jgi:hypothetical protein
MQVFLIKLVIHFSKLTGEFSSLSITDIKVLALTLQLEWELVGTAHLCQEPLKPFVSVGNSCLKRFNPKETEEKGESVEDDFILVAAKKSFKSKFD